MYKNYFGFNENPFSIAPNPRYLYMSSMHQEALAHLVFGAKSDGCITLLTGEVGTGKTTISRRFLEQLPETTNIAVVINPKLSGIELLATVCDEFQIPVTPDAQTAKSFIDAINKYLLQAHAEGKQAILVIDEAQNLEPDVLEMVRLLTNLETDSRKLLKIFLLGQSELSDLLQRPGQAQINQRITNRYHLKNLKREDLDGYIAHRISIAGGGRSQLFTSSARKLIFDATAGVPRLINTLCDHSLLGAYSENKNHADRKIVKKAAQEMFGPSFIVPERSPLTIYLLVTVGLIAFLAFGIWIGTNHDAIKSKLSCIKIQSPASPKAEEQVQEDESLFLLSDDGEG